MYYPIIKPNIIVSENRDIILDSITGIHHNAPSGVYKILSLINGKRSDCDIFGELSSTFNITKEDFNAVLSNLAGKQIIELCNEPGNKLSKHNSPIRVVSLEITEKCNLKCRYCYGNFKPSNSNRLKLEDIATLFRKLTERGVKLLEITGGEPSVHPDFNKILSLACANFEKITIMTNGVHFNETSFKIFKQYQDKIGFSISIDGFSEKSNAFQRQVPNTFIKSLNTIIRLKKEINPQYFRIVYMLTNENVSEIDAFFENMIQNGIKHLLISIPEQIDKGRTYHLPDGCNMSDRDSLSRKALEEECTRIYNKYNTQVITLMDTLGPEALKIASVLPSCGAGWGTLSFKANGDVLPCNMMENKWVLGNFKEDPNLEFLSNENPLYLFLSHINLSAENGNRNPCISCKENTFCAKCINKIFLANQRRIKRGLGICPFLSSIEIPDAILNYISK